WISRIRAQRRTPAVSGMRGTRERLRSVRPAIPRWDAAVAPLASLPNASPAFVEPMKCKLVDRLPAGEQWRYELKLDGYRALVIKSRAGVRLISRNKKTLSNDYPEIVEAVQTLPLSKGVLDGEIVAVDETGKPSFQALQHAATPRRTPRPIYYFAFDLLNLEG